MNALVDAQFLQLQHNIGQIAPQDLGVSLFLQLLDKVVFRVQAKAFARSCPTSSTGPLGCRGFGDGRDEERVDADSRVVDLLLGEAWVDHVHDCSNIRTRLGHKRENVLPSMVRDVSAMLVETTTFLPGGPPCLEGGGGGSKILCCCCGGRLEYKGTAFKGPTAFERWAI
jgi:hypothetical protein